MNLVTGYAGKGHITSADAGRLNAGICGTERYVMSTGEMFDYEVISNNEIVIKSGDLIDQGRQISIPQGTTESLTIENGTQGKNRYDAIVVRYSKDTTTGIESASLIVIKGEESPSSIEPKYPDLTSGNIYNGDPVDDTVLYYVRIYGLSITRVEKAFEVMASLASFKDVNKRIDDLIDSLIKRDVTLWSGTLNTLNSPVILSDDVNNYDYIEIYIGQYNDKYARRYEAKNGSYTISFSNTPDSDKIMDFMQLGELQISILGNRLTLIRNRAVQLLGGKTEVIEDYGECINKVVGIKYGDISNGVDPEELNNMLSEVFINE